MKLRTHPPKVGPEDASRFANSVDKRWLTSLRDGTFREDVKAALGRPLSPTDLSFLLAPVGVVLASDSLAYAEFLDVMDELTGFCHPSRKMTDEPVDDFREELTLMGSTLPLSDDQLADLPTHDRWWEFARPLIMPDEAPAPMSDEDA